MTKKMIARKTKANWGDPVSATANEKQETITYARDVLEQVHKPRFRRLESSNDRLARPSNLRQAPYFLDDLGNDLRGRTTVPDEHNVLPLRAKKGRRGDTKEKGKKGRTVSGSTGFAEERGAHTTRLTLESHCAL